MHTEVLIITPKTSLYTHTIRYHNVDLAINHDEPGVDLGLNWRPHG